MMDEDEKTESKSPQSTRSRHTLTLRQIFIGFVLIGIGLSAFRWYYFRVYVESRVVKELATLDVTSELSDKYTPIVAGGPFWSFGDGIQRPPPNTLRYSVLGAHLHVSFVSDDDADRVRDLLAQLPDLEDVSVSLAWKNRPKNEGPPVIDDQLSRAIRGIPCSGMIFNSELGGEKTFEVMRNNEHLKGVFFRQSISSHNLATICQNPNLRRLSIHGEKTSADHIAVLASAKQLVKLELYTPTIDGLAELGKLSRCELVISSRKISDNDLLEILDDLPNLIGLHFAFNKEITDPGVNCIARARSLRWVNLQDAVNVTDSGLLALVDLPGLEDLNVSDTQVTEEGVRRFCRVKKLKSIIMTSCDGCMRLRAEFPDVGFMGIEPKKTKDEVSASSLPTPEELLSPTAPKHDSGKTTP